MYMSAWVILTVSVAVFAAQEPTQQEKVVEEAVRKLGSKKASELIESAKVITASKDDGAWEKLRQALAHPDSLNVLEENKPKPDEMPREGKPLDNMYRDLATVLRVVAEGDSTHAISTLIWLTKQKEYNGKDYTWRQYLVCESLQYIRSPTAELINFCATKLKDPSLQYEIMKTLAAYGTPESTAIFEKNMTSPIYDQIIVMYRDRYENVSLFLKIYRKIPAVEDGIKYARSLLGTFFQNEIPHPLGGRYWDPIPLPQISPKGEEAKKFIALFRDFLANPGNIPLTDDEKKKFNDLIKKIEENNREETEKKK